MGANLTTMIGEIRGVGGEPVLVTSLTRRTFFANGTIQDALGPWADGNYERRSCFITLRLTKSHLCRDNFDFPTTEDPSP